MDYKELIDELRMVASWNISDCYDCNQCVKAATAIETLLAERNAAVADVQKNCNTCCWWHDGLYGGCDFSVRQAWKWRGPQNNNGMLA